MITRAYNYAILNGSFSNDIGLSEGKSGLALFLYYYGKHLNSTYHLEVAFSFLEEIIDQTNESSSQNYAGGITGFGSLLEHLNSKRLLNQEAGGILEEIEVEILKTVYTGNFKSINVSDGAAGYGMYLLARLTSVNYIEPLLQARIRETLILIIDILRKNAGIIPNDYFALLNFLGKVKNLGIYEPVTIDLYHHFLSSWKAHCADSAKATIAYNLYTLNGRNNNVSANAIFSEITELTKDSLPSNTCKALFYLCVLQSITGSDNRDSKATDNLVQLLTNNLRHFSMSQIFPFREEQKAINAGLTLGVGGLGLSLLSFATNDYSWLDLCPAYEF